MTVYKSGLYFPPEEFNKIKNQIYLFMKKES